MKRILFAAVLAAFSVPAFADVGVSVSVGQPGFYGHLDIGDAPAPQLIYREPMVIQQAPERIVQQPMYLRVRPGHERNWRKYCHEYNACGQPVYFVQESWYSNVYAPRYRDHDRSEGRGNGHGKGQGRGHGKGNNR
jgi:hypothetical protein